ncbi:MAG: ribosome biogenesis GTPase Der [Dehalococcoidia bacterium]|nr:ribosome biogenesis GTPase Der [Dehalococcoidia bacterium]
MNRELGPEQRTPVIAIVGRTNVGKSTLLNRLAGKRLAVIADLPGTTRDRVFASTSWQGRELIVVDAGGWQAKPSTILDEMVKQQAEAAIAQADAIIFLVDACQGIVTTDEEIADILRATDKPVVLAVNKIDSAKQANQVADFYHLSMGKPIAISAYHNRGIGELMDAMLVFLPPSPPSLVEPEEAKLAIVGRPNVGKSTLLNALMGSQRAITHESPGTTRDSLDAVVRWNDKKILLIDTAGIKRRGRVGVGVDYYSMLRALQAINRCDIALLLVDASEFITAQDMHIAGYIVGFGKGIVLLVNKWDLVPQAQRREFKQHLEQRLKFMPYAPVIYISSKLEQNINKIFPEAWRVWLERQKRLPKSEVDAVVKEAISSHLTPRKGSKRLRITQAYQDEARPATFIMEVNDPQLVHFSYQRYLENKLRLKFGFHGIPLQLIFTKAVRKSDKKGQARA